MSRDRYFIIKRWRELPWRYCNLSATDLTRNYTG